MHKWTLFALFCAACLLGLSVLFTSIPEETPVEEEVNIGTATLNVAAAEEVYQKNCLMCHGAEFQGGGGPALTTVGSTMTVEEIAGKIKRGGGGMPGFNSQLSAEEINNLSLWLSEMK